MTDDRCSRRVFLETAATTGAALWAGAATAAPRGPNEALRVGIVGPGGRGTALIKDFVQFHKDYNAQMTAVCDIWNYRRQTSSSLVKQTTGVEPKVYSRYEELLSDRDIDAVIIATADHQHARMLVQALEAGKDVYCEKPFANVLTEANVALAAVQKSDRVVQIGTQRRSDPKYRQAAELMKQGVLGDVVKVDVIWNAYSPYRWAVKPESLVSIHASDLDWKAFLMAKPDRPFDARVFRSFRLYRDFSSGIIDQWMTHGIDVVHMLTGEQYPTSVVAHGGIYQWRDYRENPDTIEVALEYGQGDKKFLATYATNLANEHGRATQVLGALGTLEVEDVWRLSGDGSKRRDHIEKAREIEAAPGVLHHMANWLDCVRRRDRQGVACPASAGYGHSIACIMATESYWTGRRLAFDAKAQTIKPV